MLNIFGSVEVVPSHWGKVELAALYYDCLIATKLSGEEFVQLALVHSVSSIIMVPEDYVTKEPHNPSEHANHSNTPITRTAKPI